MRKYLTAIALTFLLMCTALPFAYATTPEYEIMPFLNTSIHATSTPDLSSSGSLSVTNTYSSGDSQITQVVVTTYVEKRSLLLFWNRVDIGVAGNEWIDHGVDGYFSKTHYAQMPSSGTYRVIATFDVYNGNTLLDSLEKQKVLDY